MKTLNLNECAFIQGAGTTEKNAQDAWSSFATLTTIAAGLIGYCLVFGMYDLNASLGSIDIAPAFIN